jgi:hypothetical protein
MNGVGILKFAYLASGTSFANVWLGVGVFAGRVIFLCFGGFFVLLFEGVQHF